MRHWEVYLLSIPSRMHTPKITDRDIEDCETPAQWVLLNEPCMKLSELLEFEWRPLSQRYSHNIDVALLFLKSSQSDRTIDIDSVKVVIQRFEGMKVSINKRLHCTRKSDFHASKYPLSFILY